MKVYHKINTVFKREPDGKRKIIEGQYSVPEVVRPITPCCRRHLLRN